jgi:hypothetical protein
MRYLISRQILLNDIVIAPEEFKQYWCLKNNKPRQQFHRPTIRSADACETYPTTMKISKAVH